MDKLKFLRSKQILSIAELAELLAESENGREEDALTLIVEAISAKKLHTENIAYTVIRDYLEGDRFGDLNHFKTTMSRVDIEKWLDSLGFSIKTKSCGEVAAPSNDEGRESIPGKIPKTSHSKIAVETAWKLELSLKCKPTAKVVMDKLMGHAQNGTRPDVLKSIGNDNKSINWITSKGAEKNYSLEALQRTLEKWWQSRR